jgi:hypothetical protein
MFTALGEVDLKGQSVSVTGGQGDAGEHPLLSD